MGGGGARGARRVVERQPPRHGALLPDANGCTNLLRRAVDDATRIIDGIRANQLDGSTPCEEFTVQQLVTHLVEGAEMMATHLDGAAPSTDPSWKSVSGRLVTAAEGPGAPDDLVTLPYGDFPRRVVVQQALGETAIHAADLARSTGQSIGDDDVYARVLDGGRRRVAGRGRARSPAAVCGRRAAGRSRPRVRRSKDLVGPSLVPAPDGTYWLVTRDGTTIRFGGA